MDTKEIVEKALKGEDISPIVANLSDEEKTRVNLAIKDAAESLSKSELEKLTGLRKEMARVQNKENDKANEVFSKFRNDQLEKAKQRFFSDPRFSMTEDKKKLVEQEFESRGSDRVDADLIFEDLKKSYAVVNSDDLLKEKERAVELEKNAREFMNSQSSVDFKVSSPDDQKYSESAKELYKDWVKSGIKNKTLDDAQNLVNRGSSWKARDLSS